MKKSDTSPDLESAKKLIEDAKLARATECANELNELLKQHNCALEVALVDASQPNRFGFGVTVKPLD